MFISATLQALIQFILFMLPVAIVFLIQRKRKEQNLLKWIGCYPMPSVKIVAPILKTFFLSTAIMIIPIVVLTHFKLLDANLFATAGQAASGFTLANIYAVLVKAWLQTAVTEEIFFRGFIGKMLVRRFGFKIGNALQGLIFGLPHGLPLILVTGNWIAGIVLILCAAIVGMLQMQLNEKNGNGSIVPSILVHGVMNTLSFGSRLLP